MWYDFVSSLYFSLLSKFLFIIMYYFRSQKKKKFIPRVFQIKSKFLSIAHDDLARFLIAFSPFPSPNSLRVMSHCLHFPNHDVITIWGVFVLITYLFLPRCSQMPFLPSGLPNRPVWFQAPALCFQRMTFPGTPWAWSDTSCFVRPRLCDSFLWLHGNASWVTNHPGLPYPNPNSLLTPSHLKLGVPWLNRPFTSSFFFLILFFPFCTLSLLWFLPTLVLSLLGDSRHQASGRVTGPMEQVIEQLSLWWDGKVLKSYSKRCYRFVSEVPPVGQSILVIEGTAPELVPCVRMVLFIPPFSAHCSFEQLFKYCLRLQSVPFQCFIPTFPTLLHFSYFLLTLTIIYMLLNVFLY